MWCPASCHISASRCACRVTITIGRAAIELRLDVAGNGAHLPAEARPGRKRLSERGRSRPASPPFEVVPPNSSGLLGNSRSRTSAAGK